MKYAEKMAGGRGALGLGLAGLGGLPLAGLIVVGTVVSGMAGSGSPAVSGPASPVGDPGSVPGIPAQYLADVEAAGSRFDVPWAVLAGIYREECDFGQSTLAGCDPPGSENGAGAQGPGQFLPGTWRKGLAPHQIIQPGPPTASTTEGFATDGDGDGVADPWDPADATASTARLLAADGASTGDISGAVYAYNRSESYVQAVLGWAGTYQQEAAAAPSNGSGPSALATADPSALATADPSALATVLAFAAAQLGDPYAWGGSGPDRWDCSGLVQAAYALAGVDLAHNAAEQYRATAAERVPVGAGLRPGDLVFFGPSLAGIGHVGIVVGGGQMIDAPHTGADVRVESYDWSDLIAATRPLG
jgi:cell wall-associated NlpC family hydrolase